LILSHRYYPSEGGLPLIILHGLFGAGINWKSMAGRLSAHGPVYTFDLRNHGESPHDSRLDYTSMAADVAETCGRLGIGKAVFLGHSMGGKCAMQLVLDHPDLAAALIVVDIGPARNPARLEGVVKALRDLELSKVGSRGDADRLLSGSIPDRRVRNFLLQNLRREQGGSTTVYGWRFNLPVIAEKLDKVWDPVEGKGRVNLLPALFISGAESDYLDDGQREEALSLFPSARFSEIAGAGHWVHADSPDSFYRSTTDFLEKQLLDSFR
jgi:pimeloyl-ACP methyl ester carboxylesterase